MVQLAPQSTPCPFCTDIRIPEILEEPLVFETPPNKIQYQAECVCCGARGPLANTVAHALKLWNVRFYGKPTHGAADSTYWRSKYLAETL